MLEVAVVNFRIYWRTGVVGIVPLSIVELRSLFAVCRIVASGGELFTNTRSKTSNSVGVLGLFGSGISWWIVRRLVVDWMETSLLHAMPTQYFACNNFWSSLNFASIYLPFCIRTSWASLRCESAAVNRFFKGPKIAISSGWSNVMYEEEE